MYIHIVECYIGGQTQESYSPGIKIGDKDGYGYADIRIGGVISIKYYDGGDLRIKYRCKEEGVYYNSKFEVYFNQYDFQKIEIF